MEDRASSKDTDPKDLLEWLGLRDALAAPRAEIALALQVIGRRSDAQRRVEARWELCTKVDGAVKSRFILGAGPSIFGHDYIARQKDR